MMVKRVHVPLAGESWITQAIDITGVDSFTTTVLESGTGAFIEAVTSDDLCEVTHLVGHDVAPGFPETIDELDMYDVIVLSDIGARSITLHPKTWAHGVSHCDRRGLLRDWVEADGALCMVGGYVSYEGVNVAAKRSRVI